MRIWPAQTSVEDRGVAEEKCAWMSIAHKHPKTEAGENLLVEPPETSGLCLCWLRFMMTLATCCFLHDERVIAAREEPNSTLIVNTLTSASGRLFFVPGFVFETSLVTRFVGFSGTPPRHEAVAGAPRCVVLPEGASTRDASAGLSQTHFLLRQQRG